MCALSDPDSRFSRGRKNEDEDNWELFTQCSCIACGV